MKISGIFTLDTAALHLAQAKECPWPPHAQSQRLLLAEWI